MRRVVVTLSDQVANELELLKKTGWFKDENEVIELALADFARLNRFPLAQELAGSTAVVSGRQSQDWFSTRLRGS